MPARPGTIQATFQSLEIDRMLDNRPEQKAYNGGLRWAENVEAVPQGGLTLAPRSVHVGDLVDGAARLFPFTDADGVAAILIASPASFRVWSNGAEVASIVSPYDADHLIELDVCQQLDTAFFWHRSVSPRRIVRTSPTAWAIDEAPLEHLPNWDYGAVYTNGVAAVWEIEFFGVDATTSFYLTISKQDTPSLSIQTSTDTFLGLIARDAVAASLQAAILALPNVSPGLTVTATSDTKYVITFGGEGNEGDGWAVSVKVVNNAGAAIISYHKVIGIMPGEPVISELRGWPRTGVFYQQRLLMAGFGSLPNAWIYSIEGDYYNFDDRLDEANGPALVPMDIPGGEAIVKLFAGRNLMIYTSFSEYWLSDRAISKLTAPNHVLASSYGSRPGIPVLENEGGSLSLQKGGSVICECRYTDVQGNYETQSISLVGAHLFEGLRTHAIQRAATRGSANRYLAVRNDGDARIGTILREQEITGFGRLTTDGDFIDVTVDGDNRAFAIIERDRGGSRVRSLERFSSADLLDAAVDVVLDPPSAFVSGLDRHEGHVVWAIADDDVFGPYTVVDGAIALPRPVSSATVGRWSPPVIETLPLSMLVAEGVWLAKGTRIHTVRISIEDTTSIAVAANFVKSDPEQSPLAAAAGKIIAVPLRRWGQAADVGELAAPKSGWITVSGLKGYSDEPTVLITQLRPGRLTIKSIVIEATK